MLAQPKTIRGANEGRVEKSNEGEPSSLILGSRSRIGKELFIEYQLGLVIAESLTSSGEKFCEIKDCENNQQ